MADDPQEDSQQSTGNEISDTVRLPVGLEIEGTRYRNVTVDEMSGIDDHNIAGKKAGNNGAKGVTLILIRCIQEVEGHLPRKQNPDKMFDRSLARKLTVVDRDFLLSKIFQLGGDTEALMAGQCPRCEAVWEEEVLFSELEVVEWPEDEKTEISFELPVGLKVTEKGVTKIHTKGIMRFPTGKDQELAGELGDNAAVVFDAMFSACITSLGDLEQVNREAIRRLKSRDRRYLSQILQEALPGLRQWKIVKCSCGKNFDINVDLTAFFGGRRSTEKKY